MTSLDLLGEWRIHLVAGLLVLHCGCARSQTDQGGEWDPNPAEMDIEDTALFSPMAPDTSRYSFGIYEIRQVIGKPYATLRAGQGSDAVQVIDEQDKTCFEVITTTDLDGDGNEEILLRDISACRGTHGLDRFFVIGKGADGAYRRSASKGLAFRAPVIEPWKGSPSILIENLEGVTASKSLRHPTERYVYQNGELNLVETIDQDMSPAVIELLATAYDSLPSSDSLRISYDLDGDGRQDRIVGWLWPQWHCVRWSVYFGNGKSMLDGTPFKRLGVLASVTDGFHDLVVDHDRKLVWKGKRYEEQND